MKIKSVIAIAIMALSVTGCAFNNIAESRKKVEADAADLQGISAGEIREMQGRKVVSKSAGIWLPIEKMETQAVLPDALAKPFEINRTFLSIIEVAERISLLTGIPVSVAPDAIEDPLASSAMGGATGASSAVPSLPPIPSGLPSIPMNRGQAMNPFDDPSSAFKAHYSGTVAGFLDAVGARYTTDWEFSKGRINIFRYKTKSFVVRALPGNVSLKSSITSSGTDQSANTNSSSDLSAQFDADALDTWAALKASVDAMLTPKGKAVASPALGTITVTDVPAVVTKVGEFIDQQNDHMGKQVAVSIQVLNVSMKRADDYGIDWKLVNESVQRRLGASLATNTLPEVSGAGLLTLKVVDAAVDAAGNPVSSATTSSWQGSSALIQALSEQGKVSVVTNTTAVTLNNQPVPVRVGRSTTYLASSEMSAAGDNSPTQVTLTPGTVNTGFSMNVLPHIQKDDVVLLQYGIDLTTLLGIGMVKSNESMIQTPDLEMRRFIQRARLRSGETLVLAGFEQTEDTTTDRGIGDPQNLLLGGSTSGKSGRSMIVVMIRPIVLDL